MINVLQDKVKNLDSRREKDGKDEMEAKTAGQLKAINEEKRSLQIKHEKVCAENKIFKNENEALVKDFNSLNFCIKTLKKEVKEIRYKNEKNYGALLSQDQNPHRVQDSQKYRGKRSKNKNKES